VKRLVILGAGKFSLEIASYLAESELSGLADTALHLAVGDETVCAERVAGRVDDHGPDREAGYVLGVSDPAERARLIEGFIGRHQLELPPVVHRTAVVGSGVRQGPGNVIGPHCYVGVNVQLGAFNVLNALCSVGHHSVIGDDNFFAPDVHLGNSVEIGHHNLFGIGVVVIHEIAIGDFNRVQAGTVLAEPLESGDLVMGTAALKRVGLYRRKQNG